MSFKPVIAGMVQVLAGGGGGAITDPGVAYIRSDGSDSTGNGSPGSPFRTWQAAITAGFLNFDFGEGDFGDAVLVGGVGAFVSVRGRGQTRTRIGSITCTGTGYVSLLGAGLRNATVGTITVPTGLTLTLLDFYCAGIIADVTGSDSAPSVLLYGSSLVGGGISGTCVDGVGASVTVEAPSRVSGAVDVSTSGSGAAGTIHISGGGSVGSLNPDAATVAGAIINNIFYTNSYP